MNILDTRLDLLKTIPHKSDLKFAEIGVFLGQFSKDILDIVKPSELYLVDIWTGEWGSGDKDGENHVSIPDMELVYLQLIKQTINKNNVHVIRAKSQNFFNTWNNDFFDVMYIDGDHEYHAVYNDMIGALHKTKNGGLLMGHDYHHHIKIAVDNFCKDFNQKIDTVTRDGCPSFCIRVNK